MFSELAASCIAEGLEVFMKFRHQAMKGLLTDDIQRYTRNPVSAYNIQC